MLSINNRRTNELEYNNTAKLYAIIPASNMTPENYLLKSNPLLCRLAVQRVLDGELPKAVTDSYGLGEKTIFRWLKVANEQGLDALAPKPRPGSGRKLSELEEQEVKRWVLGGDPRQYGFDFGLWTRQIVADLIQERLNISIGVTTVGELLHRVGLTPQKLMRRAYERNDEEITAWKKNVYPDIKKSAKNRGQRYSGLMKHPSGPMILYLELGD